MVASPNLARDPRPTGDAGPRRERRTTAVFVKRPIAGAVKTRLVPPLDADQARALAEAMLDDAVRIHGRPLEDGTLLPYELELAVAPAGSAPWFEARYPGVPVREQKGEDLGERLANWFEDRAGEGRTLVVFGADCPRLLPRWITSAHERLEAGADAVFAPDGSGGYALVGLAKPIRELFTEIEMSTGDMLARTLDLAASRGLSVELLPAQLDVDTEPDLRRLARELNTLALAGGAALDPYQFPVETHRVLLELLEGCPA